MKYTHLFTPSPFPSADALNTQAHADVSLPLSVPVTTAHGEVVDRVHVPAGTVLVLPANALHVAEAVWGGDAKVFEPARWLEGLANVPERAREIQGHRHLLTFIDGPRA